VKVGDLVKIKKSSLTVDAYGEDLLGLIVKHNKYLAHPYEVAWFFKHGEFVFFWEDKDDLMLINSNEDRRFGSSKT